MKEEKDLHTINCKTLLKEIKENLNNGSPSNVHGLGDLILSGWYCSRSGLQIQCNHYRNFNGFFHKWKSQSSNLLGIARIPEESEQY
jgi:hypothetical protein